jgi:hypothetical protein
MGRAGCVVDSEVELSVVLADSAVSGCLRQALMAVQTATAISETFQKLLLWEDRARIT